MADNVTLPGTGALVSSEEVTTLNGEAVTAQQVQRLGAAIVTADGTAIDLPGTAANGLDVDPTRLPVDGDGALGKVKLMALDPDVDTAYQCEGSPDYGLEVDVTRMPDVTLAANSGVDIGDVDVTSLPVDGDGFNARVALRGYDLDAESYADVTLYSGAVRAYITAEVPISGRVMDTAGEIYDVSLGASVAIKFEKISAASSGNNTIVAAVADKKIRVLSLTLSASAAVNAKFQSAAGGTDITGLYYLAANGGMVLPYSKQGWFETAASALLNLNLSGAVAVGGCITYIEV